MLLGKVAAALPLAAICRAFIPVLLGVVGCPAESVFGPLRNETKVAL